MKIDIIIPHKNDSDNLIRLISSIDFLNNNDVDFRAIIVDDHSSDSHLIKLKKLGNENIKLLFNETHVKSAGKSRNIGLMHAKGDYILFADSDDYFSNNLSEKLSTFKHKKADLFYFTPLVIDENYNEISNEDYRKKFKTLIENYLSDPSEHNLNQIVLRFDAPWSKLIKKSVILDNGIFFSETLKHNDTIFSQLVGYYAQNIEVVNDNIYVVQNNNNSISHKITAPYLFDAVKISAESIVLKRKLYGKKFLQENNPEVFSEPIMYILRVIKNLRSIRGIFKSIDIYHSYNIGLTQALFSYIKNNKGRKKIENTKVSKKM
ncbi:glycosyltransferase family 2 protein [Enterococcus bulliens]